MPCIEEGASRGDKDGRAREVAGKTSVCHRHKSLKDLLKADERLIRWEMKKHALDLANCYRQQWQKGSFPPNWSSWQPKPGAHLNLKWLPNWFFITSKTQFQSIYPKFINQTLSTCSALFPNIFFYESCCYIFLSLWAHTYSFILSVIW